MKQYLLFKGAIYYPAGGWEDFAGDFDSLEEAISKGRKNTDERYDWWQVVDTEREDDRMCAWLWDGESGRLE